MTTIQIYGRLGRAPEQRTTAAGKAMVTASVVVDLGRDGEMPEWFSLAAFGTVGEGLARHVKGDMISVSGRLTKSAWTGRDGVERSGFSVLVDFIASARTVRPGKPKAEARRGAADGGVPFDDPLRF
ncbi:MAG: single-stranded DNA-binding protein [Gammaproteobacteria bacterium]